MPYVPLLSSPRQNRVALRDQCVHDPADPCAWPSRSPLSPIAVPADPALEVDLSGQVFQLPPLLLECRRSVRLGTVPVIRPGMGKPK